MLDSPCFLATTWTRAGATCDVVAMTSCTGSIRSGRQSKRCKCKQAIYLATGSTHHCHCHLSHDLRSSIVNLPSPVLSSDPKKSSRNRVIFSANGLVLGAPNSDEGRRRCSTSHMYCVTPCHHEAGQTTQRLPVPSLSIFLKYTYALSVCWEAKSSAVGMETISDTRASASSMSVTVSVVHAP